LEELATGHADALAAYEKALAYTASDDHVRRGRIYGKIAEIWVLMHRHEQAHQYYTLAESVLEKASQRDAAWWGEWFRIKTKRMELYYWQNRPEEIAELARRIHPLIEQHGTVTQRIHYLDVLGMAALRRDRYFNSSDAITYSSEALALSLKTGDLGEIADKYFQYGFSLLSSGHLDEAEAAFRIALEMTEQGGHLVLLTRVLTYLAFTYRRRADTERVHEYATYGLRIAGQAKMPQYIGMAQAQMAWLAWRAGDLAKTKRLAAAAVEGWDGLGLAQSGVMFRWLALFPLMDVALQEGESEQAVQWAQHLLAPPQQRLPDDLARLLTRAIADWENGQGDGAIHLLRRSLQRARALHYL
jgi:tetratricopeptide (TPR) repeat protein